MIITGLWGRVKPPTSNKSHSAAIMILSVVVLAPAAFVEAADWEIRVGDDVSVEILCRQSPVVTSNYVFWGADWKYAGAQMKLDPSRPEGKTFSGQVEGLGLEVKGEVVALAANNLMYTWNIDAQRDLAGIIGGGLEFRLVLDSPSLETATQQPVLLDANRGWCWQVSPEGPIVVEFDKPIANVYFERGNKNQIRTMFVGANVPKGTQAVSMTVTLPTGGVIAKTFAERYGPAETSDWYSDALPHDASPVDLSFLNHRPAGRYGFIKALGDKLVFEKGGEARFWGGNIAAYAIYVDKAQIEAQAERIAQLGYNLMRFHHHDSMSWVGRTVIDKNRPDSQHLDAEVMDRLDYWIKCLRDRGVYVWLDLHVGRVFKEGDEIGEGFAEMDRRTEGEGAEGKGYCYFNDRITQLMKQFNQEYLSHINRYTALAYKDDPAIMGLLITNENDITSHFGNLMLRDKNNPYHNKLFEAQAKEFAEEHGLDFNQTLRTWEPGPSKLFLADCEYRWNRRMLDALGAVGVKVPVSTTQMWGGMALFGLPSVAASGIIDVHSYGSAEALSVNPRFADNYVSYIAVGQAHDKPVSITEWNVPYPAVDRFTSPLYIAGISALQGWDAPMIYNYSQQSFERLDRQGTWSTFSDVAITGMMPAAALLYRQGHVSPAKNEYCIMLDKQKLYMEDSHPKNMASLRTLVEQSEVTIGLPDAKELEWDRQTKVAGSVKVITDTDRDYIAPGQSFVRSDTGELTRDWVKGYQIIDTERTAAVQGWIGGEDLQLKAASFDIATPKAAVAVSSLDGEEIGKSRRMLISAVARAVPSPGGRMPMLSEPVKGRIHIAGPQGLKLIPLAGDGSELDAIELKYTNGKYIVELPAERGTHWFLLTAKDRPFYMGFTPFPPDITPEAIERTYKGITASSDIICHHFDDGVPWPEALAGKPFSKHLTDGWKTRRDNTPANFKVFVAVTPLNAFRKGMALYHGEKDNMPLPKAFENKAFDDPDIMKAYLEYCRRSVEYFKPAYLAIGIEVNELVHNSPEKWPAFVTLYRYVYSRLKKDYPQMPIFATFTLHNMLQDGWSDIELQRRKVKEFLPEVDIAGISFYPFMKTLGAPERPFEAFDWIREFVGDKPIAITETGFPAEPTHLKDFNVTLPGGEQSQAAYIESVLSAAGRDRYLFVIAFLYQDYDALWEKIKGSFSGDWAAAWRDCGLIDGDGKERLAYEVWRKYVRAKYLRYSN